MLTIGVTSDTHVPARSRSLPQAIISAFSAVDLIFHAGDLTCLEVLEELSDLAPVHAVFGNMDDAQVRGRLEAQRIVEVEGCRVGLMHGSGSPIGLEGRALRAFRGNGVQAVVFGHSHRPLIKRTGNVLLFNPGSPIGKGFAPYRSFGRLTVDGEAVSGELIRIANQRSSML